MIVYGVFRTPPMDRTLLSDEVLDLRFHSQKRHVVEDRNFHEGTRRPFLGMGIKFNYSDSWSLYLRSTGLSRREKERVIIVGMTTRSGLYGPNYGA